MLILKVESIQQLQAEFLIENTGRTHYFGDLKVKQIIKKPEKNIDHLFIIKRNYDFVFTTIIDNLYAN